MCRAAQPRRDAGASSRRTGFDRLLELGFEVEAHSHAAAILEMDFPNAVADVSRKAEKLFSTIRSFSAANH